MSSPKISIVIPSFNSVKFIGKTLESIFNQKYKNFEVIIQDGGSADGTVEIIKKFAKKYPIKWESKKDNGQTDAINKGLRKTIGEVLTYINADDVYERGTFKAVADAYKQNPGKLWAAGRGMVIGKDGNRIAGLSTFYKNIFLQLNTKFFLLATNYLMQPSVFFSRSAYKKYGPIPGNPSYVLEYGFWLKLARIEMPLIIPQYLSSFRISGQNISSVSYQKLLRDDYDLVRKFTSNPIILFFHKVNNWGRILTIHLLPK